MKKTIFFISLVLYLLNGCDKSTGPKIEDGVVEGNIINTMSFNYNGVQDTISFMAEMNGYKENEVVFWGSGKGLKNTLMLTFKLKDSGKTEINTEMTGYWDLGLCIPFNKYLLTSDTTNYIHINYYNRSTNVIQGDFNLKFKYEKDTTSAAIFKQGRFKAKINMNHSFKYCIEG